VTAVMPKKTTRKAYSKDLLSLSGFCAFAAALPGKTWSLDSGIP
jgi:hypothetical protein